MTELSQSLENYYAHKMIENVDTGSALQHFFQWDITSSGIQLVGKFAWARYLDKLANSKPVKFMRLNNPE